MPAIHFESHRSLLREFDAGSARPVDAVIVPAGRSAAHLRVAAGLAQDLGATLLLMCFPGGADPREFSVIATDFPALIWHCMQVPETLRHPLLPASGAPHPNSPDWRHGPLSTKRNLALLASRMLRWHTVLFLDDDIADLDANEVRSAASKLDAATAIGFTVGKFADNSVVCHANRLSGRNQDVFVGAPALLVNMDKPLGFFPNVYNEDWLFIYDAVAAGRVGSVNKVRQLSYDPYASPARAMAEERGDVLAEGLMAALHTDTAAGPPLDVTYWKDFLLARATFIDAAADRLTSIRPQKADDALSSLAAARRRLAAISAADCVTYLRQWRNDLSDWQDLLNGVEHVGSILAVEEALQLPDAFVALSA